MVWPRSKNPTVGIAASNNDLTVQVRFGRIGQNHEKNVGIDMYVKQAGRDPRYARYVARRSIANMGIKNLIKNSEASTGEVRLWYTGIELRMKVKYRPIRKSVTAGFRRLAVLVR